MKYTVFAVCLAGISLSNAASLNEQVHAPADDHDDIFAELFGDGQGEGEAIPHVDHDSMFDTNTLKSMAERMGMKISDKELEEMVPMMQQWSNQFKNFHFPTKLNEQAKDGKAPKVDFDHHKMLESVSSLLGLDNLSGDQVDKMAPHLDKYLENIQGMMKKHSDGASHHDMLKHAAKAMNLDLKDHEVEELVPLMARYQDMFAGMFGGKGGPARSEL
uniref:RxLR effector protein n=1 Tax=Chromera velia CCMP2878 TaxID=1169474 RepID=A0A0G4FZ41_9ALVE|mmetsp:Transcript_47199/g.93100  ORF Transcript_47199/g.93100 Transcript_47199/m.93100 type:complete len:217 (+) Transcript_47199:128-778(+)|eukprot:Cvel_19488.t1-p1 / transcript=Cvel_19488.t1 / gene=Cvel_19488 / organism=Chromera_velia_CCMP2878 / gene_product=hypothetical protein / transcript_product=hypothetical protein / location=Cvel_scaffold1684:16928-17575(-) / protein_length=216 / sequence_SO=supercontig / SO=protein_coding / is_pseudo=false